MDCGLCESISGSEGCRSPTPWCTPVLGCFRQWVRTTAVPGGMLGSEGLALRYHDLASRACAFGCCVLFSENEGYVICVSREPTVLAPLLSWGLLPRLESLKVMGMAVKEGNRAGWKEFLLGNGGLALAGNSCSQIKKKNNALPGANAEQKSYLGRESWTVPASLLCTSIVFSSQKGKKTY